jgi:CRISPR-associated endonuclease/helicase Cas3
VLINVLPLYSRLADSEAKAGVSYHQQASWDVIADPTVDAVINCALTGDGKSYAAFGAFPNGEVMALYPTNELVRDQQRQLQSYPNQNLRIQRVTGWDLENWARAAKQSKAETLLDLSQADILLTNPDLFYYLHQGNYIKDFLKDGIGDRLDLWSQIDQKFKAIIFDEFHLYQPSQVSGVLNTILLMRSVGIKHKYLFLSATPNKYLVKCLELAGLNYRIIDPAASHCYSCSPPPTGYRQISQTIELFIEPGDTNGSGIVRGEQWIYENVSSILNFFSEHPGSKGAIILNSIPAVKRVRRFLGTRFKELGLKVSENTGFTDKEDVETAIAADMVVGTSTLDVGVDFRINFLIMEGHDATAFIQRLGRLGRHPGFAAYKGYALVPKWFVARMGMELAGDFNAETATCDRLTLNRIVQEQHREINTFGQYYKRWSPVQALVIGQQLRHSDLGGKYLDAFDQYRRSCEALYGANLRQIYEQCQHWTQEAAQLRTSNLIIAEARAFRGTSSLQAAVLDFTGGKDKPTIKTYNLPSLLGAFKWRPLTKEEFIEKSGRKKVNLPSFVEHCRLFFEVEEINEKYENWSFIYNESGYDELAGKLQVRKGLWVDTYNYELGNLNRQLSKIGIVTFIAHENPDMLRSRLKLPLHFPIYGLKQNIHDRYCYYSVAFDQAALMLNAYLGQGEAISRDMITHHSKQVFQSEIDEDDAFMVAIANQENADLEWAESVEIILEEFPDHPAELAEQHFREAIGQRGVIAYLRHNYSNYERELNQRKVKSQAVYERVKERFNQAIVRALRS